MAAWQFDLLFLPRSAVASADGDRGDALPLVAEPLIVDTHRYLCESLGVPWNMCEGVLVFGPEQGCRIDLAVDPEGNAEVSARIDSRSNADEFFPLLIALTLQLDCSLFSPELDRSVEPTANALSESLMRSAAWAYALNPGVAHRRNGGNHS